MGYSRILQGVQGQLGQIDPRLYQIGILGVLLAYGTAWLDFEIVPVNAIVIITSALLTQYACTRIWSDPSARQSPEGSLREARKRDPLPRPGTSPAATETHSKS